MRNLIYLLFWPIKFLFVILSSILLLADRNMRANALFVLSFFVAILIPVWLLVHLELESRLIFSGIGYLVAILITFALYERDINRKNIAGFLLTLLWGAMIGIWL